MTVFGRPAYVPLVVTPLLPRGLRPVCGNQDFESACSPAASAQAKTTCHAGLPFGLSTLGSYQESELLAEGAQVLAQFADRAVLVANHPYLRPFGPVVEV